MSFRKREYDMSPRKDKGESKLRMDRRPTNARITDPSLPAGKRKEIDNVMKKARASHDNEAWNKKLLEVEKRDPNRWKHSGYRKLYVENRESSSGSDRDRSDRGKMFNMGRRSRSRSRSRRRTPSPTGRKISPRSPGYKTFNARRSRSRSNSRSRIRRSPPSRSPVFSNRGRPPPLEPMSRRRSPPPPQHFVNTRRPSPNGHQIPPVRTRARSPPPIVRPKSMMIAKPKRPLSPLPSQGRQKARSPSSCTDDSCSVCSDHQDRRQIPRARPPSKTRIRPRSPPIMPARKKMEVPSTSLQRPRPASPEPIKHVKQRKHDKGPIVYEKEISIPRNDSDEGSVPVPKKKQKKRIQNSDSGKKSKKTKIRTRIKIEGEKQTQRPRSPSSASDDSSSSSGSGTIPSITATTRLTLSERFGKIAQWSVDRSNMENMNMRITKNSNGGELKVMIEEEDDQNPPRRYNRPEEFTGVGHYPEELMAQGPTGFTAGSWDDVRVRFDYYKGRGYLRDLDLQDYVKWEEWWYKYQQWLKQERFYEMWENRAQMRRRGRKKVPIQTRLN